MQDDYAIELLISDLLTNLAIALLAVDIAVYTISVSLLGSQLKMSALYIKRRLEETEARIKKIQENKGLSKENIGPIQEELDRFQREEQSYRSNLFCLNVKGAVFYPSAFFFVSLLVVISSNFTTGDLFIQIITFAISALFLAFGTYRIFLTLRSIDFAATNIPMPDFEVVFYENGQNKISLKLKEPKKITVSLDNNGYDMGENVEVNLMFPPEFQVDETEDVDLAIQQSISDYPNYTGVSMSIDYIHVNSSIWFDILLTPLKVGTYKIHCFVNERKLAEKETELIIEVR